MMKADLIVFSGQSNMQGETEGVPAVNEPIRNALEYRLLSDSLIPLLHPCGEDIGSSLLAPHKGCGSIPPYFCDAYIKETGGNVIALHAAKGATKVEEWQPGTERFGTLCNKIGKGILKTSKEFEIEKKYFVWLQGESDALSSTKKEDYKACLRTFYDELKLLFSFERFLIIRVGKFAGDNRDLEIIKAQEELALEKDFTLLTRLSAKLTQSPEYMNPNAYGHYSNEGLRLLAEAAGKNAARLRDNRPLILEEEYYEDLKHII